MFTHYHPLSYAVSIAALALGCGASSPAPKTPVLTPDEARATAQDEVVSQAIPDGHAWLLAVGGRVAARCPTLESTTPALDDAWTRAQWRRDIVALADCMQNGELRGRSVVLRAHVGARGWESYGMSEGKLRATHIADALVALGVPKNRVMVVELDDQATPANILEQRATLDRRIDLVLERTPDTHTVRVEPTGMAEASAMR